MNQKMHGALICFTGIDGSGKTTQAQLLVDELRRQGKDAVYLWNRGGRGVNDLLIALGRSLLRVSSKKLKTLDSRNEPYYHNYQQRKSKMFRFPIIRSLWGASLRFDHIRHIRSITSPLLKSGKVVVSDRYIWDSTVDLAVTLNENEAWLSSRDNLRTWQSVPQPDIAFYLDISPEIAFVRKKDIPSIDYVVKRVGFYQAISALQGMRRIDGCQDPADIHGDVLAQVNELLIRKEALCRD